MTQRGRCGAEQTEFERALPIACLVGSAGISLPLQDGIDPDRAASAARFAMEGNRVGVPRMLSQNLLRPIAGRAAEQAGTR